MTHGGDIWAAADLGGIRPSDIIDFSASVCPLGSSPRAVEAIGEATALLGAYPDPHARELVEAISNYYGLASDCILPANGSTELIYLVASALKARNALIVEPAFSEYRKALLLNGTTVEPLLAVDDNFSPTAGANIDAGVIIEAVRGGGYELLFIANPANPTGALISKEDMLKITAACEQTGTVVIIDEAFCDFAEAESMKGETGSFENLIVLRSMTKFFSLAGVRLGFLTARPEMVERLRARQYPWSINTLAMVAGIATLGDDNYISAIRDWFHSEQRPFYESLSAIPALTVYPSAANFFMIKLPDGWRGDLLKAELLKERLLIRTLDGFAGLGGSFIRVALLDGAKNRLLTVALNRAFDT